MKFKASVEQEVASKIDMPTFAAMLLNVPTQLHYQHLQTRSFAKHSALNFYSDLTDQADGFIEMYQGLYQVIDEYPAVGVDNIKDPVVTLQELHATIEASRAKAWFPQDRCLQNKIDEIQGAIAGTLYKLRFLE